MRVKRLDCVGAFSKSIECNFVKYRIRLSNAAYVVTKFQGSLNLDDFTPLLLRNVVETHYYACASHAMIE